MKLILQGEPSYLGDGLFVRWEQFQIKLYATDGITETNAVYLEPLVLEKFEMWVAELRKAAKERAETMR